MTVMAFIYSVLKLVLPLVWVATFIMMLVSRKKFTFNDLGLTTIQKFALLLMSVLLTGYTVFSAYTVYYAIAHPDFEYEKVSTQAGHHIYRPKTIPGNRTQMLVFHFDDKMDLAGKSPVVKTAYDTSFADLAAGAKPSPIIVRQAKMDASFHLSDYVYSLSEKFQQPKATIRSVTLTGWANSPAFIRENKGESVTFTEVYVLSPDNVLVHLMTPGETAENLILMADSME